MEIVYQNTVASIQLTLGEDRFVVQNRVQAPAFSPKFTRAFNYQLDEESQGTPRSATEFVIGKFLQKTAMA